MAGRPDGEWTLKDLRSIRVRNLHFEGMGKKLPSTVCVLTFIDENNEVRVQSKPAFDTCNPSWFFSMQAVTCRPGWWNRVRTLKVSAYLINKKRNEHDGSKEILSRTLEFHTLVCVGVGVHARQSLTDLPLNFMFFSLQGRSLHMSPQDLDLNPGLKAKLALRSPGRFHARSESLSVEEHVKDILGPSALERQASLEFSNSPVLDADAKGEFTERMMHLLQVVGPEAVRSLLVSVRKFGTLKEQCDGMGEELEKRISRSSTAMQRLHMLNQLRLEVHQKRKMLKQRQKLLELDQEAIRFFHDSCIRQLEDLEPVKHQVEQFRGSLKDSGTRNEDESAALSHNTFCLLWVKRLKLICGLKEIYPLQVRFTESGKVLVIRGLFVSLTVPVHNNQDDEQSSTAFGFLTQLIFLISKYLNIPLRYLPLPHGSRASMCDPVLWTQMDDSLHRPKPSQGVLMMDWLRKPFPSPFVYEAQRELSAFPPASGALAGLPWVTPLYWRGLDRSARSKYEVAVFQVKECIRQIVVAWDDHRPSNSQEAEDNGRWSRGCSRCATGNDKFDVLLETVEEYIDTLRLAISPGASLIPKQDNSQDRNGYSKSTMSIPGNGVAAAVAFARKNVLAKVLNSRGTSGNSSEPLISLDAPYQTSETRKYGSDS